MSQFAGRVWETTTTTGTGTLSLGGARSGLYRSFVDGVGSGKAVLYAIKHRNEQEWETGLGVVTDATPDTLSRLIVTESSNANALVNFSAGIKDVTLPVPAFHMRNLSQLPRRVRVATTANGTISTAFANGQTVDGVTLATGDRILLKDQSTASQNGIYTVNASGSPTRSVDLYTGDGAAGSVVIVEQGTANADTIWLCTSNSGSDVVGTNSLAFSCVASTTIVRTGDSPQFTTVGIGASANTHNAIRFSSTLTGNASPAGISLIASINGDASTGYSGVNSFPLLVAGSYTVPFVRHYQVVNVSIGSGAALTTQTGVYIASLTGATNNRGVQCSIAAASNAWGWYGDGTVNNLTNGAWIFGQTSAPTLGSNQAAIYAKDNAGTAEIYVKDEGGTETQISPHPAEIVGSHPALMQSLGLPEVSIPFGVQSTQTVAGKRVTVDIGALARCIEYLMDRAGKPVELVVEEDVEPEATWDELQDFAEAQHAAKVADYESKRLEWEYAVAVEQAKPEEDRQEIPAFSETDPGEFTRKPKPQWIAKVEREKAKKEKPERGAANAPR